MILKIRRKFKLYKRYKANIWGDIIKRRRYIKLIQALRGNRSRINETKLIRRLILRLDLRQPKKRSRKINLAQKVYYQRGMIKRLYGNYKEKDFKRYMMKYKRGKDIIQKIEHRVDTMIWRAAFVSSVNEGQEWMRKGYVTVNGEIEKDGTREMKEGDIVSIVKSMYGVVVRNLLMKLYGGSYVLPTKFSYEVNYRTMEIMLFKEITARRLKYLVNMKGGTMLRRIRDE
jgi:ribosomal protein S4